MAFGVWKFQAAMRVREGATCTFNYSISNNSCIHWTNRAVRDAKLLSRLPF